MVEMKGQLSWRSPFRAADMKCDGVGKNQNRLVERGGDGMYECISVGHDALLASIYQHESKHSKASRRQH